MEFLMNLIIKNENNQLAASRFIILLQWQSFLTLSHLIRGSILTLSVRIYLMTPMICLATWVPTCHSMMMVVRRHYVVLELSERSRRSSGPGPQWSIALATTIAVTGSRWLMVMMVVVFAHVHRGEHFGSAEQTVVETTEQVALRKKIYIFKS